VLSVFADLHDLLLKVLWIGYCQCSDITWIVSVGYQLVCYIDEPIIVSNFLINMICRVSKLMTSASVGIFFKKDFGELS